MQVLTGEVTRLAAALEQAQREAVNPRFEP